MLNKILNVAKNTILDPSKADMVLESRLFGSFTCSSEESPNTFYKLLADLRNAKCIYGGYELVDVMKQHEVRTSLSVGLFYMKFHDIPMFIRIMEERNKEGRETIAKLFVPANQVDIFTNLLPKLFPVSSEPKHYILGADTRDYGYVRNMRTATCIGNFDKTYGVEKPLVEEGAFQTLNDLFQRFNECPDFYSSRNKPRKEVIMLYGPPGTGKTSVIRYLTGKYNMHLIEFNANVKGLFLIKLINDLKGEPAVVLVEDIETYTHLVKLQDLTEKEIKDMSLFNELGGRPAQSTARLDQGYGDFINLLDGIRALKNCIFIFTTNHPELLRPPIYRMGRVTARIEMNYPATDTVRSFLGFRKTDKRWKYLADLEDSRLPLDAIYRIKEAKTVSAIEAIIVDRDLSLSLKDKKSYA